MKARNIGLTLASLLLSPIANASDISTVGKIQTEVFNNNKGNLSDTRSLILVGDRGNIQFRYFARDRLFLDYEGTANNLLLQSFGVGFHGLRIDGQLQAINDQISPWVGIGYDGEINDFFGLVEVHTLLEESPIGELNTLGIWRPSVNDDILYLEYQGLHWINNGVPFSGTSRARAGYSPIKPLTLGLGSEINYEIGLETSVQMGGFMRIGN